jgi:hypothetical protein
MKGIPSPRWSNHWTDSRPLWVPAVLKEWAFSDVGIAENITTTQISSKDGQWAEIFISGRVKLSQFMYMNVCASCRFKVQSFVRFLIKLRIKGIPVCSWNVTIDVTLGNLIINLRTLF